ncbi:hypothetical protein B0H14DRAFT_3468294 [Mycena olivaceomarginata]|nr:hypothetical protein B0H14DRAFT_3468294 [Mycena olivaceomarginata]
MGPGGNPGRESLEKASSRRIVVRSQAEGRATHDARAEDPHAEAGNRDTRCHQRAAEENPGSCSHRAAGENSDDCSHRAAVEKQDKHHQDHHQQDKKRTRPPSQVEARDQVAENGLEEAKLCRDTSSASASLRAKYRVPAQVQVQKHLHKAPVPAREANTLGRGTTMAAGLVKDHTTTQMSQSRPYAAAVAGTVAAARDRMQTNSTPPCAAGIAGAEREAHIPAVDQQGARIPPVPAANQQAGRIPIVPETNLQAAHILPVPAVHQQEVHIPPTQLALAPDAWTQVAELAVDLRPTPTPPTRPCAPAGIPAPLLLPPCSAAGNPAPAESVLAKDTPPARRILVLRLLLLIRAWIRRAPAPRRAACMLHLLRLIRPRPTALVPAPALVPLGSPCARTIRSFPTSTRTTNTMYRPLRPLRARADPTRCIGCSGGRSAPILAPPPPTVSLLLPHAPGLLPPGMRGVQRRRACTDARARSKVACERADGGAAETALAVAAVALVAVPAPLLLHRLLLHRRRLHHRRPVVLQRICRRRHILPLRLLAPLLLCPDIKLRLRLARRLRQLLSFFSGTTAAAGLRPDDDEAPAPEDEDEEEADTVLVMRPRGPVLQLLAREGVVESWMRRSLRRPSAAKPAMRMYL